MGARRRIRILGATILCCTASSVVARGSEEANPQKVHTSQDLVDQATAESTATPVSIAAGSCSAGGCHAAMLSKAYVHGAVAMGECTDCHTARTPPVGMISSCGSGYMFKTSLVDPDGCLSCHEMERATELHAAIVASGCTTCHDPHSSDSPRLLLEDTPKELCMMCHDQGDGANPHRPVKDGQCTDCHDPHSGVERPLLKMPAAEICDSCHKVDERLVKGQRHIHKPVAERKCTSCHDAHQSRHRALLKQEPTAVCLRCHSSKSTNAKSGETRLKISVDSKHKHEALTIGDCVDCHRPHASNWLRLLRKPQPALCHDCHERKDDHDYVHSALRLGQCSTCHDPHGGSRPPIMRFSKNRDMCFACHADDLMGRPHVHNPARSDCMFCHLPHGSDNPNNLKKTGVALCFSCHFMDSEVKFKHAAMEQSGCTACHDPHGTAYKSYLIKPINALCASCHPSHADGRHVPGTAMAGPKGHPIDGATDPKRPGRRMSCASCHNPHGSHFSKMLRHGGGGMAMCAYCHFGDEKQAGAPRRLPSIGQIPPSNNVKKTSGSQNVPGR